MRQSPFAAVVFFIGLLVVSITACSKSEAPADSSLQRADSQEIVIRHPLAVHPATAKTRFVELTASQTGVDFINPTDESHPLNYLYASAMSTGGAAIADVDGDGQQDIFLAGGCVANKLFRQTSRMKFEDITDSAGVDGGEAWAVGCAFADVDNDGDPDLYVCNYITPNQLFLNDGKGKFTEVASQNGVDFADASHTPSFCDYDGDGDLDLYILTNRWYRPEGFPEEKTLGKAADGRPMVLPKFQRHYAARQTGPGQWESMVVGRPDILCRNDGKGKFTEVTKEVGIDHRGHGLSATWWDWSGDGFPDLWVGNDFDDPDHIYLNNGRGKFRDVTTSTIGHLTWFSMGADFGDLNADGLADFLIADMAGSNHFKQKTAMGSMSSKAWFLDNVRPAQVMRNSLFINAGNGRFLEGAYLAGLANTDWTWAVRLCDFDHDGLNDAFFQCGMSRNFNEKDDKELREKDRKLTQWQRFRHLPPMKEKNRAFRNLGNMQFEDVSADWGIDHFGMSYGCAVGDLDGDGSLDMVSVRLNEPVVIYQNTGAGGGNSITISFRGVESNKKGIGVQARLATDDATPPQVRQLTTSRGYLGSDQPILHFGLGDVENVQRLELRWPSGIRQDVMNLKANHHYEITESQSADAKPWQSPEQPLFEEEYSLKYVEHKETIFDDFEREPLLPNKQSQLGPGQAWGDVNGDGIADLFAGGATGADRLIRVRDGDSFEKILLSKSSDENDAEDMGVLLFDADGDGDNDLYVVSGSTECEADDDRLQDRLYFNSGDGNFQRAPAKHLPKVRANGSSVCAADFDRDGDLDLFVGGRTIPGEYPLADKCQLLRNDGKGKFSNVIDEVAPDAASGKAGVVTGAVWSDVDDDGWIDLVLAREWSTIGIFHNAKGKLKPLAVKGGIENQYGWWNGVTAADLDQDGDFDLVATNFGRNTKYHPKPGKPVLLFYGDIDGSGESNIVEAEYEGDTLYPVRGKSCSTCAMPSLADKFDTYKGFAMASLQEIYPKENLQSVRKFSVTNLNHAVFWNNGGGDFSYEPLPWQSQLSPAYGVILQDVNADGRPDITLAQNFLTPQRETGPMASGLSLLMFNREQNDQTVFEPIWPHKSGLSVDGDAKSLAAPDLNGDGAPDLSFGRNNDSMLGFIRSQKSLDEKTQRFAVKLRGSSGNPEAVGARVTVNQRYHAEVQAGAGYLSQSPAALYFCLPDKESLDSIRVRWPDGKETDHSPAVESGVVIIQR